ncbi:hypothetical protein ACP70R_015755 [Stipagrostis hirtigluma subsp. patula]
MKSKGLKNKSPGSGFTRFSVKYFSEVLGSLTDDQKAVIQRFGFGCLLNFQKCAVPKRFVKWVARKVDVRSHDIVQNGKIISFSKDFVHWVLDLPIGGDEIHSDSDSGRSFLLSEFGKTAMPPISFFGNMLKDKNLSDEKTFICFMIVALASFLCPTANIHPSSKYFDLFRDLDKVKDHDRSKYVFDWSMDMIAKFSVGNKGTGRKSKSLGGCIYFLAVVYLDHVDFGSRQVQGDIPRVNVWKGDMIKCYSELDELQDGVYGKRPLKDFSSTCYNLAPSSGEKKSTSHTSCGGVAHFDFMKALDKDFGQFFTEEIQIGIYDIVQKHHEESSIDSNIKAEMLVIDVLHYLNNTYCEFLHERKNPVSARKVYENQCDLNHLELYDQFFDEHMESINNGAATDVENDGSAPNDEVQLLYVKEAKKKSDLQGDAARASKLMDAFNDVADDVSAHKPAGLTVNI